MALKGKTKKTVSVKKESSFRKASEDKPSFVKRSSRAPASLSPKASEVGEIQKKEIKKYIYATGGRKEAKVQLKLYLNGKGTFSVNDKDYLKYFPYFEFQKIIFAPLEILGLNNKFDILVRVRGGGIRGQAEAIRYALAHALVKFNPDFRKSFKKIKFLTRDSRIKERKKFGLKKARRAPQWQKR